MAEETIIVIQEDGQGMAQSFVLPASMGQGLVPVCDNSQVTEIIIENASVDISQSSDVERISEHSDTLSASLSEVISWKKDNDTDTQINHCWAKPSNISQVDHSITMDGKLQDLTEPASTHNLNSNQKIDLPSETSLNSDTKSLQSVNSESVFADHKESKITGFVEFTDLGHVNFDSTKPSPAQVMPKADCPFVCGVCSEAFKQALSLDIHMFSHTYKDQLFLRSEKKKKDYQTKSEKGTIKIKPFVCAVCQEDVPNRKCLTMHMKNEHNVDVIFACWYCRTCTITDIEHAAHVESDSHKAVVEEFRKLQAERPKEFLCPKCGALFHNKYSMTRHIETHNAAYKKKVEKCPHCSFETHSKQQLSRHVAEHTKQIVKCSQCSFTTPFMRQLKKHAKIHLKTLEHKLKYFCRECDSKFEQMYELRLHVIDVHNSRDAFFCTKCNYACQFRSMYSSHMKFHRRKHNQQCDQCNYTCCGQAMMEVHKRKHTGEKPFPCSSCSSMFASNELLRRHVQRRHATDKPFLCTECSQAFVARRDLFHHMIVHTGVKQYCCNLCDYQTNNSANFKQHLKRHKPDKPYSCPHCDYKGRLKQYLKSHLRRVHKIDISNKNIHTELSDDETEERKS